MATIDKQKAEITQMLREAKQYRDAEGISDATADAQYERVMAGDFSGLVSVEDGTVVVQAKDISARPQAGAPASNQFGTFQVHEASPAQVAFLRRLLGERTHDRMADAPRVIKMVSEGKISKKAASAAIDILLGNPKTAAPAPEATLAEANTATPKQIGFIKSLLAKIDPTLAQNLRVEMNNAWTEGRFTRQAASAMIDAIQMLPAAPKTPAAAIEPGVYINDTTGTILRAYLGQQSGQILAKEVVLVTPATDTTPAEYDLQYRGLAARHVTSDFRRMGLDEAKAWGRTTSTCCVCAARLDDPTSVDAGIGPVCAKRI